MTRPMREAVNAAAAGGLALVAVHAASYAILVHGLRQLPHAAREAVSSIGPHLVEFQARLAFAVLLAGAAAGALGWAALRALRARATTLRAAAVGLGGCAALVARSVAHKPALFEPVLWRNGGAGAFLEVLLAERIGIRAIDVLLATAAVGAASAMAWRNREVLRGACAAAAARLRTLEAVRRRRIAVAAAAVCIAGAAAALLPHRRAHFPRRPIVVLAADSLRPDHFSSEGYARPTTPNLDRLRARAGWVEDDFVPIARTTPSWASMLTGTYPHTHGVRHMFPRAEQTRLRVPTLPRLLAEHGYRTAVVSDYAGEMFNRVDFGFEVTDAPPATSLEVFAEREVFQRLPLALALFSGRIGQRLFPVAEYLPVNADPADLTERAFSRLDRLEHEGKPFLLVVFYSVTHAPFAAPMPDAAAFADSAYRGPSRYSYEIQDVQDIARAAAPVSDEEARQVRALYDGALRSFDREVGRFVARLDRDGLSDRILVVTGDHGENLFEPGTTTEHGKWFAGGEAANRTALLIEAKEIRPGSTLSRLASGIDFAPTLLALAGVPAASTMQGRSLLDPEPLDRTVFAETGIWLGGSGDAPAGALTYPGIADLLESEEGTHALVLRERWENTVVTAKLRAARSGPWEATYMPTSGAPVWSLFDLKSDPYAQRDVSAEHPETLAKLQRELVSWLAGDRLRWLDARDHLVARFDQ